VVIVDDVDDVDGVDGAVTAVESGTATDARSSSSFRDEIAIAPTTMTTVSTPAIT